MRLGGRDVSKLRDGPVQVERPAEMDLIELDDLRVVNRSRLEGMARARTSYATIAANTGLARVLGRYKMFVSPNQDAMAAHLILDGFWEMWNTIFLAQFVRPGWSVIEVGARFGYFSLLMADLVGPTGRLAVFEPAEQLNALLRRSIGINGFDARSVVEEPEPISSHEAGRTPVQTAQIDLERAKLQRASAGSACATTLDLYCAENSLAPDFIKIAGGGGEQAVWRGLAGLLSRQHKIAIMSWLDTNRVYGWRQWLAELEGQEFRFYRVGYDSRVRLISPQAMEEVGSCEMLALRGYPGNFGA